MKYLFLDTNIFLHFQNFEQIPWAELVKDNDFKIIVSDIVAGEIDKHKDSARGKIQKRAKVISKLFGDVFLSGNEISVPLEYCMSYPEKLLDEEKVKFNPLSQDDQILMGILASDYPKESVVVVSYDNPILIKAKAHGLRILKMPDKYLLKEELSEEEKELERCKKEIATYKNRMSKPVLLINKEKDCLKIKRTPLLDVEKELEKHMLEIRSQYPHKALPSVTEDSTPFNSLLKNYLIIDTDGVKSYNTYLDSFYKREEKYRRILLEKEMLEERMVELSFSLCNEGTDETGNINVFIQFPKEIKLYNSTSKKKVTIDKPSTPPPYAPFQDPRLKESWRLFSSTYGDSNVRIWNLEADVQNRSFSYMTYALNHHVVHTFEEENGLYIDTETCGNFQIKYQIIDSKHPDCIKGVINVVVE